MTLSQPLHFRVPDELEAHEPAEYRGIPRDHVQLLVSDRASGVVDHAMFVDLGAFLRPGDLLVANDSGTIPAALDGTRQSGEPLTLHLSAPVAGTLWIVEPRGTAQPNERIDLPGEGRAILLTPVDDGAPRLWYARIDVPEPLDEYLADYGRAIRYRYVPRDVPIEAYQTIFARTPGSAEMPSAARPFTQRVLDSLMRHGVQVATVTLHCGVSSAEAHEPPQPERFEVDASTSEAVNRAHAAGGRVVAIGTSVVRALESAARSDGVVPMRGWTDLIVTRERGVHAVDGILTGLHEPEASHLAMLQAFLSDGDLQAAYEAALTHKYLWHEFGDVHLIL